MEFEQEEYTLPAFWAGYLINNTPIRELAAFEAGPIKWFKEMGIERSREDFWSLKNPTQEPYFSHKHDGWIVAPYACESLDFIFIKKVKEEVKDS